MFETLTDRLSSTLRNLSGRGRLTEDNIKDSIREVRRALLEADVSLPVVTQFISEIQTKAIGQEVMKSLRPGDALVKIVNDELVLIMGEKNDELNLQATPPVVILLAGLQGSGKTTTTAKLALFLKEQKKSVMVTSCDVYRPAAIQQLETLAKQVDVAYFPSDATQDPVKIAKNAVAEAKKQHSDVIIVDTAGRMHVDDEMMVEIQAIHSAINPIETLFVVDSMTGQDAANTAKAFNDALPLTGVILTKTDGDARGGAALSIRHITGKPIKFLGAGEKIAALEPFHPDRMASRILGMGDVLSLVEEAKRKVDKKEAERVAKKIQKGKAFDLQDYLSQLQQMKNMGGMSSLLGKLPGMGSMPPGLKAMMDDSQFTKMEAIILSMTPRERAHPQIIKGSHKKRIASGSGTSIQDINRLIKQFTQMQKMMKKLKGGGMEKMMKKMQGLMPPGGSDGMPF